MSNLFTTCDRRQDAWKSLKQAGKKMSPFVLSDPQIPPRQSLAPKLGADVHSQAQSPLFSTVPAEIRNRIFSIALTAYDDPTKPYQPQNWFYRPDWHFHPKISTTLLRTCRRIYLECHLLPLFLNSHTFWAGADRGPPPDYFPDAFKQQLPSGRGRRRLGNWNACENFRGFFNKLTAEQRAAVGELHFFYQQYYLESVKFSPPLDPEASRPIAARRLKITMRHQDWYWWENNERLGLCPWNRGRTMWDTMDTPMPQTRVDWLSSPGWGAQLQYVQGLEEFELEMETVVDKKAQMDGIVERAKQWVFPLKEDKFLSWHGGTGLKESTWEEDDLPLHGNVSSPDPLTANNLAVLDAAEPAQQNVRSDALSQSSVIAQSGAVTSAPPQVAPTPPAPAKRRYYVVSLTWKVQASVEEELRSSEQTAGEWKPMGGRIIL